MNIGVTGSRTLTSTQRRQVIQIFRGILSCYGPSDVLHHGGAVGVDAIAASVANQYGLKVIPHHPQEPTWGGKSGYKARNMEIVDASSVVYAIHAPQSTTGGTIWTYNYAIEQGKSCEWIELLADEQPLRRNR